MPNGFLPRWSRSPSERDIQSAEKMIESKRQIGSAVTGKQMTTAHQAALKRLTKRPNGNGRSEADKEWQRRRGIYGGKGMVR